MVLRVGKSFFASLRNEFDGLCVGQNFFASLWNEFNDFVRGPKAFSLPWEMNLMVLCVGHKLFCFPGE